MGTFDFVLQKLQHTQQTTKNFKIPTMVWEKVFAFFDADNSGEIDFKEVKARATSIGADPAKVDKLEALFKKFDKDGSGELDKVEFEALMNDRVKVHFEKLDADKSGNISPAELKAANAKNVDEFLKIADKDGDGEISLAEFSAAIAEKPKIGIPFLMSLPL